MDDTLVPSEHPNKISQERSPHSRKKLQSRNVAAVSRPPCFEPRGSKVEDFGLETEPTSANRRNQMKFQVSPTSAALPHSRKKLCSPLP